MTKAELIAKLIALQIPDDSMVYLGPCDGYVDELLAIEVRNPDNSIWLYFGQKQE